jgi:protein-S-isoprenylcysteine O-methyltransferase Ste14
MILFLGWRPIDTIVWNVTNPALAGILWAVFWIGWATVLISTFLISHFELFGLQQAWLNISGRQAEKPQLRQPLFYRWVAHPMMSGFFLALWAAPEMTAGHLLLAFGMSIYILIALRYEERDLTGLFGDDYRRYRSGVGMLIPRLGRGNGRVAPGA